MPYVKLPMLPVLVPSAVVILPFAPSTPIPNEPDAEPL